MLPKDPIVIVSAARTPIGHFGGYFKETPVTALGSAVIKGVMQRANLTDTHIDEVLMGCVLPAGLGQAPARQAAIGAGLSVNTPCTTINKMCGSGMKTIMLAHDRLLTGDIQFAIAGGMENMSRAPYLLSQARFGYRLGKGTIDDHMMLDGLEDAYQHEPMGIFAERCAQQYEFSRQQQDNFARISFERAKYAADHGLFAKEIVPFLATQDEGPSKLNPEKIPLLKPAFQPNGTVTAANSSSISDGAAGVLLTRRATAQQQGLPILATIVGHVTYAQDPAWFTTAPIAAIQNLLTKIGWTSEQVDLFEINEAFAIVTMVAIKQLKLDIARVNVHGGACVLGHPIGASGARIVVTLLHALQQRNLQRGIAALCIGGGEATALAIECEQP